MNGWKLFFFFGILTGCCGQLFGQSIEVHWQCANEAVRPLVDSLNAQPPFETAQLALVAQREVIKSLEKKGYFEAVYKVRDVDAQRRIIELETGPRVQKMTIIISPILYSQFPTVFLAGQQKMVLPIEQVAQQLNSWSMQLEKLGFSFNEVFLTHFERAADQLEAQLEMKQSTRRFLNEIVVNGFSKFPESHRKNLYRQFRRKPFSADLVEKIHREMSQYPFARTLKYPELLFTKDSTKVFTYLEKAANNVFDGFAGFSNDESKKLRLNGYLDLLLHNTLKAGEKLELNWKDNGRLQSQFHFGFTLPYAFKTPLGIRAQLHILRQDSTFQSTTSEIALGYLFRYNSRLYMGYQETESSSLLQTKSNLVNDLTRTFYTLSYEWSQQGSNVMYPEKSNLMMQWGWGSRHTFGNDQPQWQLLFSGNYLFEMGARHAIWVQQTTKWLSSSSYLTNELFRFGGIQSFRGVAENSLQATALSVIQSEYRFMAAANVYVHTVFDYGWVQDQTLPNDLGRHTLAGFGAGMGLLNKSSLFKIIYAVGQIDGQAPEGSNGLVQLSYRTTF
jgi:hypothetical protein